MPLVSAVWSCGPELVVDYPAAYLFTFLRHHGMLSFSGSPQWRTVVGGSNAYVERAAKELTAVRVATPVRSVRRTSAGLEVYDADGGAEAFDAAVIATHADQALGLLGSPTTAQRQVLGAFGYSRNATVLHADTSVLPRARAAHASWNYRMSACTPDAGRVRVSYDMNRLQRLDTPDRFLVTLNDDGAIPADRTIDRMVYEHPIYTPTALEAQRRLPELNDGVLRVRRRLPRMGIPRGRLPVGRRGRGKPRFRLVERRLRVVGPMRAALFRCVVRHARTGPVRHCFAHRTYQWFVDIDELPRLPLPLRPLARFEARDHLGDPAATIRANVDAFLALHAIDLGGGPIRLLTNARVLGYVFNPLSVFWCHRADGSLASVIAEVHNTYGERHCYLLRPNGSPDGDRPDRDRPGRTGSTRSSMFRRSMSRRRLSDAAAGASRRARAGDRVDPARRRPVRRDRDRTPDPGIASHGPARRPTVSMGDRGGEPADPMARHPPLPSWAARCATPHTPAPGARAVSQLVVRPTPAPRGAMHSTGIDAERWPDVARVPRSLGRAGLARAVIGRVTRRLPIQVQLPDGSRMSCGRTDVDGEPVLVLHRPDAFYRRVAAGGLIGFGEAYQAGDWDCADLVGLISAFADGVEIDCPARIPLASSRTRAALSAK